ncbi:hypothetical protein SISNIDRAFT_463243 [Sistotremastrum niveocremeum HHB9708]|uniref:Uncharacterized protein n=1 Tax=Sistotremastrum niveocremeum HHB9708 TaxID=1314777 RepID=A0A164YXC0_9AGAM|nr:hypothetical protein SISNIDRAFT_463243 [Sistotremastrum niveocremeum HHB9708]
MIIDSPTITTSETSRASSQIQALNSPPPPSYTTIDDAQNIPIIDIKYHSNSLFDFAQHASPVQLNCENIEPIHGSNEEQTVERRQGSDPFDPPPPSFSRPTRNGSNFVSFPHMRLDGIPNAHLDACFPIMLPPSSMRPHPFVTHDVTEVDWTRFLEDMQIIGALTRRQRSLYDVSSNAKYVGITGYLIAQAIEGSKKKKHELPVVNFIEIWNDRFFHPRKMRVVLVKGFEPVASEDDKSLQASMPAIYSPFFSTNLSTMAEYANEDLGSRKRSCGGSCARNSRSGHKQWWNQTCLMNGDQITQWAERDDLCGLSCKEKKMARQQDRVLRDSYHLVVLSL